MILEEARRNLRRHPREAAAAVAAIAAATVTLGVLAEYFELVGKARQVTGGNPVMGHQEVARPLVVAVGLAAALLAGATVVAASARRRRTDRLVLERLGAGPELTSLPALVEGLAVGIAGGVLGMVLTLAASTPVTSFERSTIPAGYTVHQSAQNGGGGGAYGRARTTTYRFPLHEIATGPVKLTIIAIGTLLFGVGVGLATAALTLRRRPAPTAPLQ